MENVTLTPKEQTRLQVLNSLLADHMTLDQAATLLGVSERHTRRILAAYHERGAAALAHGPRGRRAPNATPAALAADVVHLAGTVLACKAGTGSINKCCNQGCPNTTLVILGDLTCRNVSCNVRKKVTTGVTTK